MARHRPRPRAERKTAEQQEHDQPKPLEAGEGERLGTIVNQCEDQITVRFDAREGEKQPFEAREGDKVVPATRTFFVDRDADVKLGDQVVSVKDLVPGDRVKLPENAEDYLDKVEAERPERIALKLQATK